MPAESEARLRLAHHVAGLIMESNGHRNAQTWFQGMNPQLQDLSPRAPDPGSQPGPKRPRSSGRCPRLRPSERTAAPALLAGIKALAMG